MTSARRERLPPPPSVLVLLCACGSTDWIACAPGDAPFEAGEMGLNVVPFGPQPGQSPKCWCLPCWGKAHIVDKKPAEALAMGGD